MKNASPKVFGVGFLAVTLLCALILGGQQWAVADKSGYPQAKSKRLFAETDMRGKELSSLDVQKWVGGAAPDMKGKVILVDLWATWCGPCRRLIPELNEFQKKYKNDLVVVGLSDEPVATLEEFKKATPMEYAVATDMRKTLKRKLGVEGIPHVLIISPDNIVRWQGFPGNGEDPLTEETVAAIIAASKEK